MAEALGLTASIVALVQLSASVYSVTTKFYRGGKDAKSKISALATQIRNLSGVLQSLSLLASAPLFDDAGVSSVDFRDTYIESCHSTLQKIKRKVEKAESDIESGSHRKVVTRSLKWPLAAQEIDEWITELSQHQDVLQLALSAETMSHLLQCLANTRSTSKSIQHLNQRFDRKETIDLRAELTKKREEIVRFFLKVNPEVNLQDCRSLRQPNTGRWLVEKNETFRDWLDSPGSRIWLSGIPGAGKTILCGTVVEEILQKQTHSTAVAFFFCDYKSAQSHEPVNVLGALAVQLAKQGDAAFELLESYYDELHPQNGIAKPPVTKGMIGVIRNMINEYASVYLAIDGLDECGSKAVEVIRSLKELAKGDQVTMALFSRNEPDISDELSNGSHIEIAAHTEDLELYVLAQMESRKRLRNLAVKNAELHEHILHTLIQGANGMFRWVACQLDHLDGLPSDGKRRRALTELPPTLFETYDRIIDRIMQEDEHSQELCRKALHWIGLGAKRMSALALCEAISIEDDQDAVDMVDADWVSRSCSSLIRLSTEDSEFPHFQLAHFTVEEYLRSIKPQSQRSTFRFSEDEAIQKLLQTSLRFLTFPIFDQAPIIAASEIERMAKRNRQHPFYPTAANFIFYLNDFFRHIDAAVGNELALIVKDETIMQYAMKLFNPNKTALFLSWVIQALWCWTEDPDDLKLDGGDFDNIIGLVVAPEFSTLHVAAALALPSICTYLIETQKMDINKCCRLGTPLHSLLVGVTIYWPGGLDDFYYSRDLYHRITEKEIHEQSRECLEIFLQHCADTSARCGGASVFQIAIDDMYHGQAVWYEPLINQSTMIDEACICDFEIALTEGELDQSIADAILKVGSSPDASPMWARLASLVRKSRMKERSNEGSDIQGDLQKGLSDEDFDDAVRISIDQNLTDTLKFLVQDPRFRPDVYVPVKDGESKPILHFAIQAESHELLELLLDAGCDPKAVNEAEGWTGLHQCAFKLLNTEDAANAMLLLRSGVVDSIRDKKGKTCWHIAAEHGNLPVLKALIELGSDTAKSLRTTSKEGRTPLAFAILNAQTSSALLLLDRCSAEPEVFRSDKPLLDEAVAIGSEDLFPRLYEKMKQAGVKEAPQGSKPLDSINMACSPKLVDYILTTWDPGSKSRSDALRTYLLDANSPKFEDPCMYPKRVDLDHIIRQLLPSPGVIDDQGSALNFWSTFCEKVLVNLTKLCDHEKHGCRKGLIKMILEILIEAGVLDMYERNEHLPSYRMIFQSLLDRGNDLKCSWIASSVQRVIEGSSLSADIANDAASSKLLSLAVQQSNIDLVKQLLQHDVDVHATHNALSPIEQACHDADLPTFDVVINHADRTLINRTGTQGKTMLHWTVSETAVSEK